MARKEQPPASQKKCIFCGSAGPMSNEHIWGRWLKAHVRLTMNKHHFHAERIGKPGTANISDVRLRTGDPLRSKVRVICRQCNNGWLSQIQERAKQFLIPLLEGKSAALGTAAQSAIAAWCTMATMTGEFIDKDPYSIAISQDERTWLWKTGTPPDGWRIWIGRYQRHRWPGMWVHLVVPIVDAEHIPNSAPDGTDLPNTQTTTFVIGQLYVHVMSTSANSEVVSKWMWPLGSRPARLLAQIIPAKESIITWPPDSLTDGDADFIATAFDRLIDIASRSITGRRLF